MKLVQKFREQFQEPFEEYQEKARQFWMTLAPREKIVLSSLAGALALLIVVLVVKESVSLVLNVSSTAEQNMANAEKIQRFSKDLADQRNDLQRYERLKGKRVEPFSVSSHINKTASEMGVTIEKISPTKPRLTGTLAPAKKGEPAPGSNEDWFEVQIAKGTRLEPLLKFLNDTEETLGLRIVEVSIKPDFADPTKLEASFVVAGKKEL